MEVTNERYVPVFMEIPVIHSWENSTGQTRQIRPRVDPWAGQVHGNPEKSYFLLPSETLTMAKIP